MGMLIKRTYIVFSDQECMDRINKKTYPGHTFDEYVLYFQKRLMIFASI